MPILRCDENRPRIGLSAGASLDFDAFGGIFVFFGGGGGIWFRVFGSDDVEREIAERRKQ